MHISLISDVIHWPITRLIYIRQIQRPITWLIYIIQFSIRDMQYKNKRAKPSIKL